MKTKSYIVIAILLVAVFGFIATPVGALTSAQINQLITQLQAQIAQLLQQIEVLQAQQQGIPVNWCHSFNRNLGYANSGQDDVGHLHTALNKAGISFSPDTGNTYGTGTANAVTAFQEKYTNEVLSRYRLRRGTGYTGISTRAKLNQLYGCSNENQVQSLDTVAVISPNGGEQWELGTTQEIKWNAIRSSGSRYYDINITTYQPPLPPCSGNNCPLSPVASHTIAERVAGFLYSWNVGSVSRRGQAVPKGNYTIRICVSGTNDCDSSNNYFSIVAATNCAENGQKAYGNSAFGPTVCCSATAGLKPVGIQNGSMCMATNDGSRGTCIENWEVTCGNGVCEAGEDACNCSEDCPMPVPMGS